MLPQSALLTPISDHHDLAEGKKGLIVCWASTPGNSDLVMDGILGECFADTQHRETAAPLPRRLPGDYGTPITIRIHGERENEDRKNHLRAHIKTTRPVGNAVITYRRLAGNPAVVSRISPCPASPLSRLRSTYGGGD